MNTRIMYVATGNSSKIRELEALCEGLSIALRGLADCPDYHPPDETGQTFAENSCLKARALKTYLCQKNMAFDFVLADDSGLSCDDLDGAPGIYSSRYSGAHATAKQNNAKLLSELQKITHVTRAAHFTCVLTLIDSRGNENQFEGICEGLVTFDPKGAEGFGYDPLFYIPQFNKTMAELAWS